MIFEKESLSFAQIGQLDLQTGLFGVLTANLLLLLNREALADDVHREPAQRRRVYATLAVFSSFWRKE